jgi:hypothetical protein
MDKQLKIMAEAGDPVGVTFDAKEAYVRLEAGQWLT